MYIDDIYISLKLDAGVQSLTFLKKKRGCSRKEVSKVFLLRTRSERSSRRGGGVVGVQRRSVRWR